MGELGVLLIGHGSRADGANNGMHRVAERLREQGKYDVVEVGFMIRNFPSIEDGAATCVANGARTVLLIPYFLHTGLHLIEDLPNAVPRLQKLHPGVRFTLGQPMGLHPALLDIVADRIQECKLAAEQGVSVQGDAILQRGKHLTHESHSPVARPSALFAVAAAKVAVQALKTQRKWWQVEVFSEEGEIARFPVKRCEVSSDRARSAVSVDAGDGEDDAYQLEVYVEASRREAPGVVVDLGEGIEAVLAPKDRPALVRRIDAAAAGVMGPTLAERGVRLRVSVPWWERARTVHQLEVKRRT